MYKLQDDANDSQNVGLVQVSILERGNGADISWTTARRYYLYLIDCKHDNKINQHNHYQAKQHL